MSFIQRTMLYSAATLLAAFAMAQSVAQAQTASPLGKSRLPRYSVTDLGTLGGTFSLAYGINDQGEINGFSTLPGDVVEHAFLLKRGVIIDLGTLGGPNSQSFAGVNDAAEVPGSAETSLQDPNDENFCGFGSSHICLGFLWRDGLMRALETLGGYNSQASEVNAIGQVAGYAETSLPDLDCPAPQVLHYQPVVWTRGKIHALPMYKDDSEAAAFWNNDFGQVVGASGACAAYDPRYGLPLQPQHALLWRHGKVIDLGNLGGTFNNAAFAINDVGQIIGVSDLLGDTYQHAFLWERGAMTDLGTLPGDVGSAAIGINDRGQVTGVSTDAGGNLRAFLWQDGVMTDLNDLIPADSPLYLLHGFGINFRGQIVGFALQTSTGEVHGFLANPICREGDPKDDNSTGSTAAESESGVSAKITLPAEARRLLQQWLQFRRFAPPLPDAQ